MRIGLVHSFYRSEQPSGENVVVESQADLLTAAGHDVHVEAVHTDDLMADRLYMARTAAGLLTGRGHDPSPGLRRFGPDVVHVHNLFPNMTDRWIASWPGPVVATLHNYRALCANGALFRDGHTCTLCPDGDRWAAVRHACYHGSRLATGPVAWSQRGGPARDARVRHADGLIALSASALETFVKYGAPRSRFHLIPNGVGDPQDAPTRHGSRAGWVTVGRLGPEKGLDALVRVWPTGVRLDVIGSGPLNEVLRASAGPDVSFPGALPRQDLLAALPQYAGAVFAGTNREGAHPLAVVECMAAGLPIVARVGGAAAALVRETGCGTTYESAGSLRSALHASPRQRRQWGEAGRRAWADRFSPQAWVSALEGLYSRLLERNAD